MTRRRFRYGALALLAACTPAPNGSPAGSNATPYDLVISGGRIVDGTGNAWFYGDLAVRGDRIVRITPPGRLSQAAAKQRLDAAGLVVAPGFIDIQAQSVREFTMGDGRVISMVTQGVTTAIMGEGDSPGPLSVAGLDALKKRGGDDSTMAAQVGTKLLGAKGFGGWLDLMQAHGMSENAGSFLGAATVRTYVKGEAEGPSTAAEVDTMRALVRTAMEDGAFGVGSALIYPPGAYASTEELIELAKAASPFGGIYITHMRSEADRLLESIDEAFRIGKEGGVPVEIYHLKAGGLRNHPKMAFAIAKIDSARAAGADVGADMYLYPAGSSALVSCAPPSAAADGKLFDNLADPAKRAKIKADMLHPIAGSENLCELSTPDGIQLGGFTVDSLKKWEGKRLAEVSKAMKLDWVDTWIALVRAQHDIAGIWHQMAEANVAHQLTMPWIKIGTDADGVDPDSMKGAMVHPRAYGNYPRLLGRYVREQKVLTLEDAVRKATSAVANRLSIRDRGVLREGAFADIVVFDPNTIIDRSTFEQPNQLSVGVRDVFVNGTAVLKDGKHTGAKPGQIVRGPGWTGWH